MCHVSFGFVVTRKALRLFRASSIDVKPGLMTNKELAQMGTDIHFNVERRNDSGWELVGDDQVYDEGFYIGRYYRLFGFLANVRNGRGFAGVDTGDAVKPIAMPRGLPEDVSEAVRARSDEWGGDGHSHSYLTLSELLEADWSGDAVLRGYVEKAAYRRFKETNESPTEWADLVAGPNIVTAIAADYEAMSEAKKSTVSHIQIQWRSPVSELVGDFITKTIPAMRELDENSENVRCVFWFDN